MRVDTACRHHLPGLRENLVSCRSVDPRYFRQDLRSYQGAAFGIQPVLKISLPSKWRYGIPWGTAVDNADGNEPPLRMFQRDDGVGTFEGHPRITGAGTNAYGSRNGNGPRIAGLDSTYR